MSANAGAGMMAELMLAQPDSRSVCTGMTDSGHTGLEWSSICRIESMNTV